MRNLLMIVAVACGGALIAVDASAYGWGYGPYGYGIGGLYRSLDYPTERRVPYFAAHPPVYYSLPVPRTYGHSPFAYSPMHKTPELAAECESIEVVNPHVPSSVRKQAEKKASEKAKKKNRSVSTGQEPSVSKPLIIENPYFNDDRHTT